MKSKSIIQILIVLTIILTSYFVYKSFLLKNPIDENFTLSDNVLSNTMSNKDNETYEKKQ